MAKQGKDLFEVSTEAQLRQDAPLAARMRPLTSTNMLVKST